MIFPAKVRLGMAWSGPVSSGRIRLGAASRGLARRGKARQGFPQEQQQQGKVNNNDKN